MGFKNNPINIPTIEHFPEKLYSQKDLMNIWGLDYKVSFYRKLEWLGINKIKIGNMVRYRKNEVEEEFLATMYISIFQSLKEVYNDDYVQVIQNRALDLLEL